MWTAGEKHLSYILSARIVQVYKLEHPRIYVMVKVFYLTFLASGFEVNASSFERILFRASACSPHRTVNRVDWPSQLVLPNYLS